MADITTRHLKQDATYWADPQPDGEGGWTFDPPVAIEVRWVDGNTLVINSEGQEVTSSATVYVGQDMAVGEYLAEGIHADLNPAQVAGARKIISFNKDPNLRATKTVRRAAL